MTTTLAESGLSATSKDKIRRLRLLLYGPFGTGKSINAHKMPRTRTLDFDDGMQSVEWAIKAGVLDKELNEIVYETIREDFSVKGHVAKSTAVDRASDQVDEWLAEEQEEDWDKSYPQFWDTLVIDSGSSLSDFCIWKSLDETARLGTSKSKSLTKPGGLTAMRRQDWGGASSLFQKFIEGLRVLDKNIILVCHEYHNQNNEGQLVSIDPLLIGQLRQKIGNLFDEVWYASVSGSRRNPKYEIQTQPDPDRHLKTRLGCLDYVEEADFYQIRKKVADFYEVPEEVLWTAGGRYN